LNSKTRNENDEEILLKNDNLASMFHQSAKSGEIIAFGTYPQMADGLDRMPIKWRVLKNFDTELFILSGYILDCKRYHGESVDIK